MQALLPATSFALSNIDLFGHTAWTHHVEPPGTSQKPGQGFQSSSKRSLAVISTCGAVALSGTSDTATVVALGCCNALLVSFAIALLQHAYREAARTENSNGNVVSVNGFLTQPVSQGSMSGTPLAVARDVSFGATVASCVAAFILEDLTFRTFRNAPLIAQGTANSTLGEQFRMLVYGLGMVLVHAGFNTTLITTVSFYELPLPTVPT